MKITKAAIVDLAETAAAGDVDEFIKSYRSAAHAPAPHAEMQEIVRQARANAALHSTTKLLVPIVNGIIPGFGGATGEIDLDNLESRVSPTGIWTQRPRIRIERLDQLWAQQWQKTASQLSDLDPADQQQCLADLSYAHGAWNFLVPQAWREKYSRSLSTQLASPMQARQTILFCLHQLSDLITPNEVSLKTSAMSMVGALTKVAFQSRKPNLAMQFLIPMIETLGSDTDSGEKRLRLGELSQEMREPLIRYGKFEFTQADQSLGMRQPLPTKQRDRASKLRARKSSSAVRKRRRRLLKEKSEPPREKSEPPSEQSDPAHEKSGPPPRYTDYTLSHAGTLKTKLKKAEPLQVDTRYQLEIAVRQEPTGLEPKEEREVFREPRQTEKVNIYVTLSPEPKNAFEVENNVSVIELPPGGDSKKNAVFYFTPLQKTAAIQDLLKLNVRLYYEFNLLEHASISIEVVGTTDEVPTSALGLTSPVEYEQVHVRPNLVDFDDVRPRQMSVFVYRRQDHFQFEFVLRNNEEGSGIKFDASIRRTKEDLTDKLVRVRKILEDVVYSQPYLDQIDGDDDQYRECLRQLANIGTELWTTLFKPFGGDIHLIGQWLRDHPLDDDAIVQVVIHPDASSFVFPWALIYDDEVPDGDWILPPRTGFWGLRYSIEQAPLHFVQHDLPLAAGDSVHLDFFAREAFSTFVSQQSALAELAQRAQGRLVISDPPLTDGNSCFRRLKNCEAEILYFHTHGYTRNRQSDVGYQENLALFQQRIDELPSDDPLRARFAETLQEIANDRFERDRSWIKPSHGALYLNEMESKISDEFTSSPLVILNICESAQVTATLSESFVDFFMRRGARAVLGTECSIALVFADQFGKLLLEKILGGDSIGTALLAARRTFIEDHKNPLGLAYTLFGSESLHCAPPIISDTKA